MKNKINLNEKKLLNWPNYVQYWPPIGTRVFSFCFLVFLLNLFQNAGLAQSGFCQFDENMEDLINTNPLYYEQMGVNENIIQSTMNGNPQFVMNGEVYVVPVVFHVIHLGESVGVGSNISDGRLQDALQHLNDNFRDVAGVGNDVEIEFCLAQRDPDGYSSTGINRVNGYGVGNYENIGIAVGANDVALQGLSIWPNSDYLNIWVVDEISPGNILGYAWPPGASPAVDGVVMDASATGISSASGIIAHEVGHFFDMYHTFEGGDQSNCPPNNNCNIDGDKVCDTPPHKQPTGACDTSSSNICDNSSSIGLVANNHMNYTDNSCRNEFTYDQVMRMRTVLMELRQGLMSSLGCEPVCTTVVASFYGSTYSGNVGDNISFTNTSTGASDYEWSVEGNTYSSSNLSYTFNHVGSIKVCLTASDSTCENRACRTIDIDPLGCPSNEPPECEELFNGDFSINSVPEGEVLQYLVDGAVCNWVEKNSTPFFCSESGVDQIGLWSGIPEGVVTESAMDLVDGRSYLVSFEYFVIKTEDTDPVLNAQPSLRVGLSLTNGFGNQSGDIILSQLNSLSFDGFGGENQVCISNSSPGYHLIEFCFEYASSMGKHLFFKVGTSRSNIFLRNVHVDSCSDCESSCVANSNFTFEVDSCSVTFAASGDSTNTYHWDFGDGSTGTGHTVTHDYIFGGSFNVCLTVSCGLELSSTMCQQVDIPEACSHCDTLEGTILAPICEVSEDTTNTYIANFSFQVPKGYRPCKEDDLYVHSDDVAITVTSYWIDESAVSYDEIHVAMVITTPINFNESEADGYISLCDDEGNMICRYFDIEFEGCDYCYAGIDAFATCVDSLSSDTLFAYYGMITLDTFPGSFTECGFTSTEAGLDLSYYFNGSELEISYYLETGGEGLTNVAALLCFQDGADKKHCVPLNIMIEICSSDPPPTECVAEWDDKTMTCDTIINGWTIFNFPPMQLSAGAYHLCEGELTGTIEGGGVVVVNSASIINGQFYFSIDIHMPPGFVPGQVYELRLYLCDAQGNVVCYLFPLELLCGDEGGGGGSGLMSRPSTGTSESVGIAPNPAKDRLMVTISNHSAEAVYEVRLYDMMGRMVIGKLLFSSKEVMDIGVCQSGVYFISVTRDGEVLATEKVTIVH